MSGMGGTDHDLANLCKDDGLTVILDWICFPDGKRHFFISFFLYLYLPSECIITFVSHHALLDFLALIVVFGY